MATLITDPDLEQDILARRKAWGADRYDEVWEGVYVVSPMPNDEHQELVSALTAVFYAALVGQKAQVRAGVNVSNREDDWKSNYRVPDVAVFLETGTAENRGSHWFGGPDFAVEVVSPEDRTREKISFYEEVNTRELLIVDRDPWALELFRRQGNRLVLAGQTTLDEPAELQTESISLSFELLAATPRPNIRIKHDGPGQEWIV